MPLIVHADFTDPLSWLASLRVDALVLEGVEVEWRAVRAHATLRVTSAPLDESARQRIDAVKAWHDTAALVGEPTPRIPTPPFAPWSRPPVSAFAESVGAGVADHVRSLLFTSFWLEGTDIGNPDTLRRLLTVPILRGRSRAEVLDTSGYAVAIGGGPITTDAWRLVRQWQDDWATLGSPELPVVVEGTRVLSGFAAADHLGARVREAGARIPTGSPHPLPPLRAAQRRGSLEHPGRRPTWWAS